MPTVWTIGHSNRSIEKFVEMLRRHDVQVVVDIRSWPTSKVEHFKRENMTCWLSKHGIGYVWLGKELGGYRPGGYEEYMKTPDFERGIKKLVEVARMRRACLCCKEVNPRYCHRRFVTRKLLEMGWRVIHILNEREAYEARLL